MAVLKSQIRAKTPAPSKGHRSRNVVELLNECADQEYDQQLAEIRQLRDHADLGELAHEVIEWLSLRMVNHPALGGFVLPVAHHAAMCRRLTNVLTVGFYRQLRNEDQADGHHALVEAVGLVPGRDTFVSEEGIIDCPAPLRLELDRDVARLDAIRKALGLLAGLTASSSEEPGTAGRRGVASQPQEHDPTREIWRRANEAVKMANKATGVNRDWPTYWRRWCMETHEGEVLTRQPNKPDGTPNERGIEIEIGSFARALVAHEDEFEKARPESEKRRNVLREKVDKAFRSDLGDNIQRIKDGSE